MSTNQVEVSKKHQRYSLDDRKKYVEKWKLSNLTRSEFCRLEGLQLPTFCYWVRGTKPKQEPTSALSFIPIPIASAKPSLPIERPCVEIFLPNGMRCCFTHFANTQALLQIIEGLSHVARH